MDTCGLDNSTVSNRCFSRPDSWVDDVPDVFAAMQNVIVKHYFNIMPDFFVMQDFTGTLTVTLRVGHCGSARLHRQAYCQVTGRSLSFSKTSLSCCHVTGRLSCRSARLRRHVNCHVTGRSWVVQQYFTVVLTVTLWVGHCRSA